MMMALFGIYSMITVDLIAHVNAMVSIAEKFKMMNTRGYAIESFVHLVLLFFQMLYSVLLAIYSFYVIESQTVLQNIIINAVALLFLT